MSSLTIRQRLESFISNPYNKWFLIVVLAALILRITLLIHASDQPLWWDEAEYMSTAKHWAFGVPYELNPQRPPLFQLLAALLLFLGFNEFFLKLLLVVIPSAAVVGAVFFLGKEIYNEKVAFWASLATAGMWSYLFWSARFQPDFLSLTFQLCALGFFWKFLKQGTHKWAIYGGILTGLAFYFKISALLVPMIVAPFAIWKEGLGAFKKKSYWYAVAAFVLTLVPFMIWQYALFGNPIAFAPSYSDPAGKIAAGWQPGWMAFDFIVSFQKSPLTNPLTWVSVLFFAIGSIMAATRVLFSADIMIKEKSHRLNASLFIIWALLVILFFHVYFIRGTIEDRWVFLMAPFLFYLAGLGIESVRSVVKPYGKYAPAAVAIVAMGLFLFFHISHAVDLIDVKKDSYLPVKQAGLWLKENTDPSVKVLSVSYTQTTAYAERETIEYRNWQRDRFENFIAEEHPRFLMVSIFENHPDWTNDYLTENRNRLKPVQMYTTGGTNPQPLLILFEIEYTNVSI